MTPPRRGIGRWEPFIASVVLGVGTNRQGIPASPGIGAGIVHRGQAAFRRRTVIIASQPVPNLAPLLWDASGLVTESGSPAAHLFESARALRVPAVCGVGIPPGEQLVAVDGRLGVVSTVPLPETTMAEPIGVIGLGVMGSAMARNLMRAGHQLLGFDIDATRLSTFSDIGGEPAKSAHEVAAVSDLAILSLPTTSALASVAAEYRGAGSARARLPGDGHFPLEDKIAARDVLAAAGVDLLDTPLSGTGLQAADASLVVFASGSRQGFEKARAGP